MRHPASREEAGRPARAHGGAPRRVLAGVIQCSNALNDPGAPVAAVRAAMLEKQLSLIDEAGRRGVQILCLQEIFDGPSFAPSGDLRWREMAEPVPGPTTERLSAYARRHAMAMIVPLYERDELGDFYNTAAVLDADGAYLGKYRKQHIPRTLGAGERDFFKPGNLGNPTFQTRYARVGVVICYDRHFPEGARDLGAQGAEIVFAPSATAVGLARFLWTLEQRALALSNGYFVASINRVGVEPWTAGRFYGTSYFADPSGHILAMGSETEDELVVALLELDTPEETRRDLWHRLGRLGGSALLTCTAAAFRGLGLVEDVSWLPEAIAAKGTLDPLLLRAQSAFTRLRRRAEAPADRAPPRRP